MLYIGVKRRKHTKVDKTCANIISGARRQRYPTVHQRCWSFQRWPHRWAPLVVSPAEGAARWSVTVCRDRPPRSPCEGKNRYLQQMKPSQGVSIGAPQVSQSEDWIARVWRRVASQAGVFMRAYLRNAATDWSYGSALLHRFPSGVLRGKAALQHASLSTLLACSNR
jgi:hypothetical protein